MSIHIAITRRVRPGCEERFQQELREFFRASFDHSAVMGVNMLVPPEGSTSREYGILRSFPNEAERQAFYASALFKDWETRVAPLTEGAPIYRELHGLEAWFREPAAPPPRWKMALVTFGGVYPLSVLVPRFLSPVFGGWHALLFGAIVTVVIVASLTWVVMPFFTRVLRPWLHSTQP